MLNLKLVQDIVILWHYDLNPITLKHEIVHGIVIPNTYAQLYQNWMINEIARAMTYIGMGQTPYTPPP